MKKTAILSFVFITFVILIIYPINASGWSCGREIVSVGDSKGKVLTKCGSPESSYVANEKQSGTFGSRPRSRGRYSGSYKSTTTVTEIWIYNCGANSSVYELKFEGDVLVDIRSIGRGSGWEGCRSAEERRILELD